MDPITHALLGICIAEIFFCKHLGKKARWFALICALFPCLDLVLPFSTSFDAILMEKTIFHTLILCPFWSAALGYAAWYIIGRQQHLWRWLFLSLSVFLSHILLDTCTTFGTPIFYPFVEGQWHADAISDLDLFYSLFLGLGVFFSRHVRRPRFCAAMVGLSCLYLLLGFVLNHQAQLRYKSLLDQQNYDIKRMIVRPIPLFSPLRRVLAEDTQGRFITGLYSPLARRPPIIHVRSSDYNAQIEYLLNAKNTQIFSQHIDHWLFVQQTDNEYLFFDIRNAFLSDPWTSPIHARCTHRQGEPTSALELRHQRKVHLQKELDIAWKNLILD